MANPNQKATAYPLTDRITLPAANPHRETSGDFKKFELCAANPTVGGALEAGVDRGYLRYMVAREIFAIGPTKAKKARAPRAKKAAAEKPAETRAA